MPEPKVITNALLHEWPLPFPDESGNKEGRGRVLIVGGSVEMPGAAILAATAALRSGAGKVRVAVPESVAIAVGAMVPELFVLGVADGKARSSSLRRVIDSASQADAVLVGPGMRDVAMLEEVLPELLQLAELRALILDATALHVADAALSKSGKLQGKVIITPHTSEMARLCRCSVEEIQNNPVAAAQSTAERFGCIVVLKGAKTYICNSQGAVFLNDRGNVGLGTAGSGDVLAGIAAGLAARAEPLQSAVWAVGAHARAGDLLARETGRIGYLAREIVDKIPGILHGVAPDVSNENFIAAAAPDPWPGRYPSRAESETP